MTRSVKRKPKNWKRFQSDNQIRKRVWLGLMALGFLILIVVVGKALNFVGSLSEPISHESLTAFTKSYHWDGGSNLNLIIQASDLSLISYSPEEQTLNIIKIPDQTHLKVGLGYGDWQASSVYNLGQSEKIPIGGGLLKIATSNTLGVPVDGFIKFDGSLAEMSGEKIIEQVRENPTKILAILQSSKTDLNLVELTRFLFGVRAVRFDKVDILDLATSETTKWRVLSDGSRVLEVDPILMDQHLSGSFEEDRITTERLSIAVLNSTKHPGLAEKAARMIGNIGGRVVITSSTNPQLETTIILGETSSATYHRLKQLFSSNCQIKSILMITIQDPCSSLIKEALANSYINGQKFDQADVTVILGEDFFKRY